MRIIHIQPMQTAPPIRVQQRRRHILPPFLLSLSLLLLLLLCLVASITSTASAASSSHHITLKRHRHHPLPSTPTSHPTAAPTSIHSPRSLHTHPLPDGLTRNPAASSALQASRTLYFERDTFDGLK